MKAIELLAVGLRLLGVYLFVNGVRMVLKIYQFIQTTASYEGNKYETTVAYVGVLEVVVLFVASLIMIKFPITLSKWIFPSNSDGAVVLEGKGRELETTLFVVLGVYILTRAVPDFFANAMWWLYMAQDIGQGNVNKDTVVINQLVTMIEIVIGLFLCVRADGVSILLRRLRTVGFR